VASDGSTLERVGDYVRGNRQGTVTDLVFAVARVTVVNVIFRVVDGSTWAYYRFTFAEVVAYFGFTFAGVVAYFGFVFPLEAARGSQRSG